MLKKATGIIGLFVLLLLNGNGQANKTAHISYSRQATPLKVGDIVPDIHFREVMNYPLKSASLSDFKAKITILDFWSTSCTACVRLFPHLEKLKNDFGGQLNIVLINGNTQLWHDSEEKIESLLKRQKSNTGLGMHLPIILNSPDIDALFPYKTIPEEVWLDENGKILSITGADEVNENNIRAMLDGKQFYMHQKDDVIIDLQNTSLLSAFSNNKELNGPLLGSMIHKGYIDGLNGTGVKLPDGNKCSGFYVANEPLINIYRSIDRAELAGLYDTQIIIDVLDSSLFQSVNYKDTSYYRKVYTYDLTVGPAPFDTVLNYAKEDLERFFHFQVKREVRSIPCYVVKQRISAGNTSVSFAGSGNQAQKYTVKELVEDLNAKSFSHLIVSDPEEDNKKVFFNLNQDISNVERLKTALHNAGYTIQLENRNTEVCIISDH